jgi:formate dehydrogenase subunit delta
MDTDRLVTMANEIAAFFAAEPGGPAAAGQMAGHLRKFWDPRMRRAIVAHFEAGGEGLSALAREAVALLR